ncbi:hypothetical protein CVT26_011192 [Gymnopilus dilepis]|uniref:Uncharacterized protein n=1 Tax=Gymnopilus dilepis TaxID=231916 RepID=A0A409VJQ4_9AGAR|nr:hypothetical protein CVT26_011192 [Gymnopilus dilepis]
MQPASPSHTPLSPIEVVLLALDNDFILLFFDAWRMSDLTALGRTNKRLQHITEYFIRHTYLFYNQTVVSALIQNGDVIMHGPLVFRFFDRTLQRYAWTSEPLDICVNMQSLEKVLDFLDQEAFMFHSYDCSAFRETIVRDLKCTEPWKNGPADNMDGDVINLSYLGPYTFGRLIGRHWYQRIRLQVVRCEPYQYVLSLRTSTFPNRLESAS